MADEVQKPEPSAAEKAKLDAEKLKTDQKKIDEEAANALSMLRDGKVLLPGSEKPYPLSPEKQRAFRDHLREFAKDALRKFDTDTRDVGLNTAEWKAFVEGLNKDTKEWLDKAREEAIKALQEKIGKLSAEDIKSASAQLIPYIKNHPEYLRNSSDWKTINVALATMLGFDTKYYFDEKMSDTFTRRLQSVLNAVGGKKIPVDGWIGAMTLTKIAKLLGMKEKVVFVRTTNESTDWSPIGAPRRPVDAQSGAAQRADEAAQAPVTEVATGTGETPPLPNLSGLPLERQPGLGRIDQPSEAGDVLEGFSRQQMAEMAMAALEQGEKLNEKQTIRTKQFQVMEQYLNTILHEAQGGRLWTTAGFVEASENEYETKARMAGMKGAIDQIHKAMEAVKKDPSCEKSMDELLGPHRAPEKINYGYVFVDKLSIPMDARDYMRAYGLQDTRENRPDSTEPGGILVILHRDGLLDENGKIKEPKTLEELRSQYVGLVKFMREHKDYTAARDFVENIILKSEFAAARERIQADRKEAALDQASRKIGRMFDGQNLWDTYAKAGWTNAQVRAHYGDLVRIEQEHTLNAQLAEGDWGNNFIFANTPEGRMKTAVQSQYAAMMGHDKMGISDAEFDDLIEELAINVPAIMISGGLANAGLKALSLGARTLMARMPTLAAKMGVQVLQGAEALAAVSEAGLAASKEAGVVTGQLGKVVTYADGTFALTDAVVVSGRSAAALTKLGAQVAEGALFETANTGLHGEWLFSKDLPDWASRVLWSSATLGVFHKAGKLGEVFSGKFAGKISSLSSKLAHPKLAEAVTGLVSHGFVEPAAMLLMAAAQHGAYNGGFEDFDFAHEVMHAYVSVSGLKLGGGLMRIGNKTWKPAEKVETGTDMVRDAAKESGKEAPRPEAAEAPRPSERITPENLSKMMLDQVQEMRGRLEPSVSSGRAPDSALAREILGIAPDAVLTGEGVRNARVEALKRVREEVDTKTPEGERIIIELGKTLRLAEKLLKAQAEPGAAEAAPQQPQAQAAEAAPQPPSAQQAAPPVAEPAPTAAEAPIATLPIVDATASPAAARAAEPAPAVAEPAPAPREPIAKEAYEKYRNEQQDAALRDALQKARAEVEARAAQEVADFEQIKRDLAEPIIEPPARPNDQPLSGEAQPKGREANHKEMEATREKLAAAEREVQDLFNEVRAEREAHENAPRDPSVLQKLSLKLRSLLDAFANAVASFKAARREKGDARAREKAVKDLHDAINDLRTSVREAQSAGDKVLAKAQREKSARDSDRYEAQRGAEKIRVEAMLGDKKTLASAANQAIILDRLERQPRPTDPGIARSVQDMELKLRDSLNEFKREIDDYIKDRERDLKDLHEDMRGRVLQGDRPARAEALEKQIAKAKRVLDGVFVKGPEIARRTEVADQQEFIDRARQRHAEEQADLASRGSDAALRRDQASIAQAAPPGGPLSAGEVHIAARSGGEKAVKVEAATTAPVKTFSELNVNELSALHNKIKGNKNGAPDVNLARDALGLPRDGAVKASAVAKALAKRLSELGTDKRAQAQERVLTEASNLLTRDGKPSATKSPRAEARERRAEKKNDPVHAARVEKNLRIKSDTVRIAKLEVSLRDAGILKPGESLATGDAQAVLDMHNKGGRGDVNLGPKRKVARDHDKTKTSPAEKAKWQEIYEHALEEGFAGSAEAVDRPTKAAELETRRNALKPVDVAGARELLAEYEALDKVVLEGLRSGSGDKRALIEEHKLYQQKIKEVRPIAEAPLPQPEKTSVEPVSAEVSLPVEVAANAETPTGDFKLIEHRIRGKGDVVSVVIQPTDNAGKSFYKVLENMFGDEAGFIVVNELSGRDVKKSTELATIRLNKANDPDFQRRVMEVHEELVKAKEAGLVELGEYGSYRSMPDALSDRIDALRDEFHTGERVEAQPPAPPAEVAPLRPVPAEAGVPVEVRANAEIPTGNFELKENTVRGIPGVVTVSIRPTDDAGRSFSNVLDSMFGDESGFIYVDESAGRDVQKTNALVTIRLNKANDPDFQRRVTEVHAELAKGIEDGSVELGLYGSYGSMPDALADRIDALRTEYDTGVRVEAQPPVAADRPTKAAELDARRSTLKPDDAAGARELLAEYEALEKALVEDLKKPGSDKPALIGERKQYQEKIRELRQITEVPAAKVEAVAPPVVEAATLSPEARQQFVETLQDAKLSNPSVGEVYSTSEIGMKVPHPMPDLVLPDGMSKQQGDPHITLLIPSEVKALVEKMVAEAGTGPNGKPLLSKGKAKELVEARVAQAFEALKGETPPQYEGVGKQSQGENEAFYVVVKWEAGQTLRKALGLQPMDFHVTVATLGKDVHFKADGTTPVSKGTETLIPKKKI